MDRWIIPKRRILKTATSGLFILLVLDRLSTSTPVSYLSLSVCPLTCGKTADWIGMSFGMVDQAIPRKHELDGVQIVLWEGAFRVIRSDRTIVTNGENARHRSFRQRCLFPITFLNTLQFLVLITVDWLCRLAVYGLQGIRSGSGDTKVHIFERGYIVQETCFLGKSRVHTSLQIVLAVKVAQSCRRLSVEVHALWLHMDQPRDLWFDSRSNLTSYQPRLITWNYFEKWTGGQWQNPKAAKT